MRRRDFLTGIALGALGGLPADAQEVEEHSPVRAILVITGIGPETQPIHLEAVLSELAGAGVPVSLVVRAGARSGSAMTPDNTVARVLRQFYAAFPGLIEIVAWNAGLATLRPYEKARAASDARSALTNGLWSPDEPEASSNRINTIACRQVPGSGPMTDVISAGFRNVLSLPAFSAEVFAEQNEAGVLTLLGGTKTTVQKATGVVNQPVGSLQSVLLLAAKDISDTPPALLTSATRQLAGAVRRLELEQRVVALRAQDLHMRTDAGFQRTIALHLFAADTGDARAMTDMTSFGKALDDAQIAYSTGPEPAPLPGENSSRGTYWIELSSQRAAAGQNSTLGTKTASPSPTAPLSPGVAVVLTRSPIARHGLDDSSTLHVPVLAAVDAGFTGMVSILSASDEAIDGVVTIDAAALRSPAQRTALLRDLIAIKATRVSVFLPLTTYVTNLLPRDPLFPDFRRTETSALRTAPVLGESAQEQAELRVDAQSAWRYFERVTSRSTGLCAATFVFGSTNAVGFDSVTMWEVGSQINALMAACDLGLVEDENFVKGCKAILDTVDRATRASARLPPETINTITGRGTSRFNSYDTGRLLCALDRLRHHRLAFKGIEELVASWDFSRVIIDRKLHSIRNGELVPDYASNYTDYAASALRAWGYDVASPFDVMTTPTNADKKMALLYAAAAHGPIGAEPSLLQLLESGPAPSADFLADTLLAAQTEELEATGRLVAPSETPINRSPWFSYQGYRLGTRTDPWEVRVDSENPKHATAPFLAEIRATSSKAAYLWRAMRPGPVSFGLTRMVRAAARTENGFDSAVYQASGLSTRAHSDLNTNGVILQSISHALGKEKRRG